MDQLIRLSDRACIVNNLKCAKSYLGRLKGLIGVKRFVEGEGLLITSCRSIHMWMMQVPIDAIFLKSEETTGQKCWRVTSVHPGLRPWKMLPVTDPQADDVLELPSGMAVKLLIQQGEVLCIAS